MLLTDSCQLGWLGKLIADNYMLNARLPGALRGVQTPLKQLISLLLTGEGQG
jgi:hypothetical protein